ncbi:hypothetical protein VYU27_008978 [Nannochloropsis oceanica]
MEANTDSEDLQSLIEKSRAAGAKRKESMGSKKSSSSPFKHSPLKNLFRRRLSKKRGADTNLGPQDKHQDNTMIISSSSSFPSPSSFPSSSSSSFPSPSSFPSSSSSSFPFSSSSFPSSSSSFPSSSSLPSASSSFHLPFSSSSPPSLPPSYPLSGTPASLSSPSSRPSQGVHPTSVVSSTTNTSTTSTSTSTSKNNSTSSSVITSSTTSTCIGNISSSSSSNSSSSSSSSSKRRKGEKASLWGGPGGLLLLAGSTFWGFISSYFLVMQSDRLASLEHVQPQQHPHHQEASSSSSCMLPRIPLASLPLPLRSFPSPVVVLLPDQEEGVGERGKEGGHRKYGGEKSEVGGREGGREEAHSYNAAFRMMTERENLLHKYGHLEAKLTSSNAYSQGESHKTLREYLQEEWRERERRGGREGGRGANDTMYLFGNTFGEEWASFLSHYQRPPCRTCSDPDGALSFGLGPRHSGVSWHIHGPGYSEVLHGRKRWFLYPPSSSPPPSFHPNMSSLQWQEHVLPTLGGEGGGGRREKGREEEGSGMVVEDGEEICLEAGTNAMPFICDIGPGEILHFPSMWWHAVLNLEDYNVFVSTFTQE